MTANKYFVMCLLYKQLIADCVASNFYFQKNVSKAKTRLAGMVALPLYGGT